MLSKDAPLPFFFNKWEFVSSNWFKTSVTVEAALILVSSQVL